MRQIILCFDGTGNKFHGRMRPSREQDNRTNPASGDSADSNILKIYGMLDRANGDKHYYQVFHTEFSVNVL